MVIMHDHDEISPTIIQLALDLLLNLLGDTHLLRPVVEAMPIMNSNNVSNGNENFTRIGTSCDENSLTFRKIFFYNNQ